MAGKGGILGALAARERGDMDRTAFGAALATAPLVRRIEREATLTGHRGCVNTVRYSDTGRLLLTGSDDCTIGVYDANTFQFRSFLESGHEGNIFCAYSLPHTADARVVSCAADGRVQLIDVEKEEVRTLARHTGRAHNLAIDPSSPSVVMSGGEDGVVTLFDVRSRTPATTLLECPFPLNRIHLNPVDPNRIVVCGDHYTCRIYDRRNTSQAHAVAPRLEPSQRRAAHATCAVWNARGACGRRETRPNMGLRVWMRAREADLFHNCRNSHFGVLPRGPDFPAGRRRRRARGCAGGERGPARPLRLGAVPLHWPH